jgi:hypothetical protein
VPALSGQSQTDKVIVSGQTINSNVVSSRLVGKRETESERSRESWLLQGSTSVISLLDRYGHGLDHVHCFLRSCQNSFSFGHNGN